MRNFFRDVVEYFPRGALLLVILTTIGGLVEGAVLLMVYPLLTLLFDAKGGDARIITVLARALQPLGIEVSIYSVSVMIIVGAIGQYALRIYQSWISGTLQNSYMMIMRRGVLQSFAHARWQFIQSFDSGQILNALVAEPNRCASFLAMVSAVLSSAAIAVIFALMALAISIRGTALLMVLAIAATALTYPFIRRGQRVGQRITLLNEAYAGWIGTVVSGMKFFKATASEPMAVERADATLARLGRDFVWAVFSPTLVRSVIEFSAILLLVGFLVLGVKILRLGLVDMLVILGIFFRLMPRIAVGQEALQAMYIYLPAVTRLHEFRQRAAAAAEDLVPAALPQRLDREPAAVAVRGLAVRYGERSALRGVTIDIPARSLTAIVGASGAGKTTLVDCLLGLIEPEAGEILVDGRQLDRSVLAAWRQSTGYQAQDTTLFDGTIRDNIRWLERDADDERIAVATRMAGLQDFIAALPQGYDTEIGEGGRALSGGQRQRLGIARALLSHRRLLILDEATSALDPAAERDLIANIEALKGHMTIVMITHRLAATRNADRTYVLDQGLVVEQGGFEELVARGGVFASLWRQQAQHSPQPQPEIKH